MLRDSVEKSDVLVVGAGPAGLYLARLLEKSGLKTTILEEHDSIGRPSHCSGLISKNLDSFVHPRREWIEHEVSGAFIRCGGTSLHAKKRGTAAYVIDRGKFDASLADGLENLKLGVKAETIAVKKDSVSVKTNKGIFKADMLVGCDGANSVVARHFHSGPKRLLTGVIGITQEEDYSRNVEIIISKTAAPSGFFWRIPRGRTTEYGMFSNKTDFAELEGFFRKRFQERRAGLIPMGPGKTFFERTLLVGDAAGMSKPWSGGGVIYGLTAARIAAATIIQAFEQDDFSEGFLSRYEAGWKSAFGKQILTGMLGRRLFEGMGDFEVQACLKAMGLFGPLINGMDMDFL